MILTDLTLTQVLDGLRKKEFSATELASAYLERIKKYGDTLNCYITQTPERALKNAAESDARYASGAALPLDGVPLGMKDLFATRGIRTTAASKILENFIPEYESTISQRLADAGCVLLGKTNLDEFAMGTHSKTSYFGAPVNPWKITERLSAGGSSGGSTSAVAGGLALIATGTDTGGSIRFPAAITGLVGFKPTYGVLSRFGCISFASSLDTPGTIARNVADTKLMFGAITGFDKNDATSANIVLSETPMKKHLKIGIIKEFENIKISTDMRALMDAQIKSLTDAGAEIIEVSVPNILDALAVYYVIAPAEASSNLARYDGMKYGLRVDGADVNDTYKKTRTAGFGEEVQRRMIVGTAVLASQSYDVYFLQAARVRAMITAAFDRVFEQCDFVLCPSSAGSAVPLASEMSVLENYALDMFTVAMNLAGLPAVSVPVGMDANGLPLGVQVVGRRFSDLDVLNIAQRIEEFVKFDNRPSVILGD
ncbi:MAG: Asp-tRNA(Asn)/Glu-tRNA(Gln) amidotransferase subunit GatA [Rickettsiales bacterium]|jgi:aspartyl-tRNA(Asn)/glutamyl-tRNA(Gln) amidotransferase subunit A|nr:Asp-tRNA(Asn)/Glu-tRNA(Gln) amidotransferase subunit GatA [Rickettsiales bacterium]